MSLSREQTFDLWAPAASPWSPWVKPVLFAYLPEVSSAPVESAGELAPERAAWAPPADGSCVLVIDLPGELSVKLAEAITLQGYRPIPLFNSGAGPARGPVC